ncbi:MAG TPA: AAA domain-containing protein, partial [Flavobacteriales bacterium]|nr:AAA domain-containing protein [Flavobacteriales bacterium]
MNKQFITYLGNKLKVGNLRTIHLNALPGRFATRLDIGDLEVLEGSAQEDLFQNKTYKNSNDFIFNYLLAKPSFQYKINFEKFSQQKTSPERKKMLVTLSKRLNALVNQNDDDFLEHGVKSFGFGYPIFVKRSKKDSSKLIKAPLLIWNLNISRSNNFQDQWIIERNEDAPIYINEVLLSHIANDEGIKPEDAPWSFEEDGLLERIKLTELVAWFLHRFGTKTLDVFPKIEACPDAKTIEARTGENPAILWSGIFGLYRTQKQSIIKDIEMLTDKFHEFDFAGTKTGDERVSSTAGVRTDPSQHEIIHSLLQKEFKIIQGPPGTGKSQSLTAIITNMLENKKKILVVCEKKTALDVLHANLRALGLDKLVAMVDDIEKDRKKIIDTVREVAEQGQVIRKNFNETEYDSNLQKFTEFVNDFNTKHKNLLKEFFEGKNLQELVFEYMLFQRKSKPSSNLLDGMQLSLAQEEFKGLLGKIERCADVYAGVDKEAVVYNHISAHAFKTNPVKVSDLPGMLDKSKSNLQAINVSDINAFQVFDHALLFPGNEKEFTPAKFLAGLKAAGEALKLATALEKELVLLKQSLEQDNYLDHFDFHKKSLELVKMLEVVTGHKETLQDFKNSAE